MLGLNNIFPTAISGLPRPEHLEDDIIADNVSNEYVPIHVSYIVSNNHMNRRSARHEIFEWVTNNIVMFRKIIPDSERFLSSTNTYDTLIHYLTSNITPVRYNFTRAGTSDLIKVCQGYLEHNLYGTLMCLATSDVNILNYSGITGEYRLNTDLDYKRCVKLFISNHFIDNDLFKNIFKKLNEIYISAIKNLEIDIVYLSANKLDQMFFKSTYEPVVMGPRKMASFLQEEIPILWNDQGLDLPDIVLEAESESDEVDLSF